MSAPALIPFTRAVGTVRLATEFLSAGLLQDMDAMPPSLVAHFLFGHAIELAFKSVLIANGISERDLRRLGHDLVATRNAAIVVAPAGLLDCDSGDIARLELLSPYYQAKALEYLAPGFMSLPLARELLALTERLVASVARYIDTHVRTELAKGRSV